MSNPRPKSLVRTFIASLGIAGIVPALSISLATSVAVMGHIKSEVEASATSLNQAVAQETTRFLNNSLQHLLTYTELLGNNAPRKEIASAMDLLTSAHAEVSRIFVLDRESKVLIVSPPDPRAIGEDLSGMAVLETLKDKPEAEYSRAFLAVSDGSVAVSMAKSAPNGYIFLIQLNLGSLSQFLEPLRINELDRIAILDETNRIIAHTSKSFVQEQRYETRMRGGESGSIVFTESGIRWYASLQGIPGTPWRVVYYRNATEAYSVLPDVLGIVSGVTLLCMVFVLAFGVRLWGTTKDIFDTFVRQVGNVATGRYDLKIPST